MDCPRQQIAQKQKKLIAQRCCTMTRLRMKQTRHRVVSKIRKDLWKSWDRLFLSSAASGALSMLRMRQLINKYHTKQNNIKITIIAALSIQQTFIQRALSCCSRFARIIFFAFLLRMLAVVLPIEDFQSDLLQSEQALSQSPLFLLCLILSVIKSSRLYSSSSSIIFSIESKALYSLLLLTHFRRSSLMKSACECSLDSQIQSVRYSRLKRPIEHIKRRVRPSAQTSSLKGSKYFSFGLLMVFKNQGELYSTVVRST